MNKKRCQIRTTSPITCFTVPIVGTTELNLTHDEIYKCLCAKAEVIEILVDGKRIHLDFTNYNKDNYWTKNPIGEPPVKETSDAIVAAYNYTIDSIESVPAVFDIEDTDKLGFSNALGEVNAIEDSLESIIYTTEEVIEEREIIPQIAEVKEITEDVESITTTAEVEVEYINGPMIGEDARKSAPVAKTVTASTVSNYQVASRNNSKKKNNHKK